MRVHRVEQCGVMIFGDVLRRVAEEIQVHGPVSGPRQSLDILGQLFR